MSESYFDEGVIVRGGTWRRRYCWRNEHDLIVTLTVDLTLQAVCLRCRAAGEITGLAVMFTDTPNPELTNVSTENQRDVCAFCRGTHPADLDHCICSEDQRAAEGWASCGDYPAPCNCDEGECPDRAGRAS